MSDESAADQHLFADRVRRARQMSLSERVLSGPELFDYACEVARAGIRLRDEAADPEAVEAELRRRLVIAERIM